MPTAKTRQVALLFYPLLRLSRAYALANGDIGPIRALADTYQLPAPLMSHFSQYRVDDEPIRDPSAAFGWDFDALRKEMEIVAYVANLRHVGATEEIFSDRVDIRFDEPPGRGGSIDSATLDDLEQLSGVRFENRPGSFSSWDTGALDEFEPQIAGVLNDQVKAALVECIPVSTDDEANAERRRLLIEFYEARSGAVHGSIEWYTGDQTFQLECGSVGHAWLGRAIFAHCLKAKLHLMGLLPEYQPKPFDFGPYDTVT